MPSNPSVVEAEFKPIHEGNQQRTLEAITAGAKNRARKRASGEPATFSKKKREETKARKDDPAHTSQNSILSKHLDIRLESDNKSISYILLRGIICLVPRCLHQRNLPKSRSLPSIENPA